MTKKDVKGKFEHVKTMIADVGTLEISFTNNVTKNMKIASNNGNIRCHKTVNG